MWEVWGAKPLAMPRSHVYEPAPPSEDLGFSSLLSGKGAGRRSRAECQGYEKPHSRLYRHIRSSLVPPEHLS